MGIDLFVSEDFDPEKYSFKPADEGTYDMRIIGAEIVDSKSSDRKLVKLITLIEGGEFDGRKIFDQWALPLAPDHPSLEDPENFRKNEVVKTMVLKKLETLTGEDWNQPGKSLDLRRDLIGVAFRGVIIQDEYQGKVNNKISTYMPPSEDNEGVPFTKKGFM